jgi:LacI family transcriptional regulator, repressor for deo operon, udp, cdd, tsx, nupC, and nupG
MSPAGEAPFLVLELLEGQTLAERLRRGGAVPPVEAARIAAAVADSLDMAELEALGYERPVGAARLRSGLVGLIVPELDNPIFPAFVQATESALAAYGYTPLLCTASPVVQEDEYVDVLLDRGVAGIVFVSGRHANIAVDHGRYHGLRAAGVPVVLVNGHVEGLDAPFVSADDVAAMRMAVQYLHSLGHRRIGCAMGPERYVTSQRKVRGFREALPAGTDDGLVVHSVYSVQGGQAAAETLLDLGVTAVVCGSDLMALGAIRAARARGLEVPRDVSVTGFDDSPLMAFTDPPVTTMRQDVAAMSQHAVDALLDEIRGTPQPRRELLFHTELVVRGSTGPAPAGPA